VDIEPSTNSFVQFWACVDAILEPNSRTRDLKYDAVVEGTGANNLFYVARIYSAAGSEGAALTDYDVLAPLVFKQYCIRVPSLSPGTYNFYINSDTVNFTTANLGGRDATFFRSFAGKCERSSGRTGLACIKQLSGLQSANQTITNHPPR
jgi:hypothetical protein